MKKIQIVLAACLCAATVQAELVGYWTFDSDTCQDSSGNGYDGTMNGGTYSTDVSTALGGGKSIDLTAGNHYVIIDSVAYGAVNDPFNFDKSMTVSLWTKGWPNVDWGPFVCKRGENNLGWQVRKYSTMSHVGLTLRGTTTQDLQGRTASAADGNWHHIAVSYNGYRQRIYVDGVLDIVNRATGSIPHTVERVVFGARDTDGTIGGHSRVRLDDIAIYSDVLSEAQIKILSNGGDPTTILDVVQPIGYWTFDNDDPATNIVKDASGLGRHGTSYSGGKYTNDVPAALAGGKSIDMRGTNAYVLIDSVLSNDPADPFRLGKDISISTWVKGTTGASWAPVFVAKHGENTWGWQVRRSSTVAQVGWTTRGPSNGDLQGVELVLNDGKWHHVVCTYDGAYKKIYVDGFTDKLFAATGELNDHCYERVILGAQNNGGTPSGFGDIMLDDVAIFGQVLTPQQVVALAKGVSPTNLPAASAVSPMVYDFEDGTMQGWRNILTSRLLKPGSDAIGTLYVQEYAAGGAYSEEHGNYKLEPSPYIAGNVQDNRHASMLVRSPQFVLDDSGDLSLWLLGGQGPENTYANETDNIALTHGTDGTMRAYLRRASDGEYLLSMRKTFNGVLEKLTVTQLQLESYVGETCTVDLVNGSDGGWGWIAMDDVVIPGRLLPESECNAIQFDMCQQMGNYQGIDSPGHAANRVSSDGKWWNGSGGDVAAGQLFWANGSPAPEIAIDFGATTNNAGGTNISWDVALTGTGTTGGDGVYGNFLMRDWAAAAANNDMGIRVSGLSAGYYKVFALVRELDQLARTYDVYFGVDIEKKGAAPVKKSVGATSATTWVEGENYVSAIVKVTEADQYLTVIIDSTNSEWPSIQGLQIVNITDTYRMGTMILLQ